MCQNNLQNWASIAPRKPFIKLYNNPSDQSSTQSLQNYQRRLVKLASNELDSYCQQLQGRMNNKNAHICNVFSFQLLALRQCQNSNSKQIAEIFVWIDKVTPLVQNDWTRENVVKMLVGFKRLVMIYGPFSISTQQICKDQKEEIKVWISSVLAKCKPDITLASQKDMLKNLAVIILKRNCQLAFKINAACTMRQAIDSLNSVFAFNSPSKHYKTFNFTDFKQHKNLFPACTTFQQNESLNSPKYANKSFNNYPQFPNSAKHRYKEKFFFPNHNSTYNSTTMARPQSKAYNPFVPQDLINSEKYSAKNNYYQTSNESKELHFMPDPSQQTSRANSRHLTFTPLYKFRTVSGGQPFSHRLGSQRVTDNEGQVNSNINNFDITIINNNVSNYINNVSGNKSSKGSKSPIYKHPSFFDKKAKSQGKNSKNTSFWLNSKKPEINKHSIPPQFDYKKKPQSFYQQQAFDSMADSAPQFIRNITKTVKFQEFEAQSKGRKDEKLYALSKIKKGKNQLPQKTFNILNPTNSQAPANKPNFFKKMTSIKSFNRSNTTQFFPQKKEQNNNKTVDIWTSEPRQKRFNSFAVDIQHQQQFYKKIPTTKSVRIDENQSTSSKKLEMKKQLKTEFGNLFNIAQTNQSPRCSHSQNVSNSPLVDSQAKAELMKESILKQKIKQKNQAFAQLKKEALKVLTDL